MSSRLRAMLGMAPAIALLCTPPVWGQIAAVGGEFQVNTNTFDDQEEQSV